MCKIRSICWELDSQEIKIISGNGLCMQRDVDVMEEIAAGMEAGACFG